MQLPHNETTDRILGAAFGEYSGDLFVDEAVIVELKVAMPYNSADEAPLLMN